MRPDPDAYLETVRRALSDLDAELRDDLLTDVEAFLFEAASDRDELVWQRLPTPSRFAAELREAAGVDPPARRTRRPARLHVAAAGICLALVLLPVAVHVSGSDPARRTAGVDAWRRGATTVVVSRDSGTTTATTVYYRPGPAAGFTLTPPDG